jgi:hypothetical protein
MLSTFALRVPLPPLDSDTCGLVVLSISSFRMCSFFSACLCYLLPLSWIMLTYLPELHEGEFFFSEYLPQGQAEPEVLRGPISVTTERKEGLPNH